MKKDIKNDIINTTEDTKPPRGFDENVFIVSV